MIKIAEKDITTEEVIKRWRAGYTIFSIELGGLGPGYEQAIQIALFRILGYWIDKKIDPNSLIKNNRLTEEADKDLTQLLDDMDLTGAMFGAASSTAYKFLKYGYDEIMKQVPNNRIIQVESHLPNYKT